MSPVRQRYLPARRPRRPTRLDFPVFDHGGVADAARVARGVAQLVDGLPAERGLVEVCVVDADFRPLVVVERRVGRLAELLVVGDAIAVGVGAGRVRPEFEFPAVPETVPVGVSVQRVGVYIVGRFEVGTGVAAVVQRVEARPVYPLVVHRAHESRVRNGHSCTLLLLFVHRLRY